MDIDDIRIGTEGTFLPPFENGIDTVKRIEELGYDSVWWADHLMSWIPESIWTPDIAEVAAYRDTPHVFFDALCTISVAAWSTKRILLGTAVTETFRRHPAVLAQAFLTLDHLSKGRVILGIGAGEGENVTPYGIEWNKPVSRLEEAIEIIRLLWENDKKVDFDGKFWKLKDAILALDPYEKGKYPPIWIGAMRPKMLEMTGRLGDGWLPSGLNLNLYREGLGIIRDSAKRADRDPDEITPALYTYVFLDEDHTECHRMLGTPMAKNFALILPPEMFRPYGVQHPFGQNYNGLLEFVPTRYDRKTMLEALEKVPTKLCEDNFLHGTPDEVISQIENYAKIGLKHVALNNMTFFLDIRKIKSSFKCMKKILTYFKS